jgi:hypothetical protein
MSTEYTVIKAFRYAGRDYAHGDTWTPSGHKNDRAIIASRKVLNSLALPRTTVALPSPRERGRRVKDGA